MRSDNSSAGQESRSFIEAQRRAQIITCAVDVIADMGFAKASLGQIAKRAGVSTGVTLYYFNSKDELIKEVVSHVFTAGEAFIQPLIVRDSARDALLSFIRASVEFVAANPKYLLAVMHIMRAGQAEGGQARYDPAVATPRQAGFVAILQAGQANGAFRPFDRRVMATSIIEAIDAIPPALAAEPDLDLKHYAAELMDLFDRATRA